VKYNLFEENREAGGAALELADEVKIMRPALTRRTMIEMAVCKPKNEIALVVVARRRLGAMT
jgi:hypothetical protein